MPHPAANATLRRALLLFGVGTTTLATMSAAPEASLLALPVKSVTASAWAPSAQIPAHVIDGDLTSRWSAEGNEQWLRLDLGESREIAAIEIAFPHGTRRREFFLLQLSADGKTWTEVFGGESSGKSAACERFAFAPQPARFVRYLGFGNADSAWNTVGEIRVLGPAARP